MGKDGRFYFSTAGASVPPLDAAAMSRVFTVRYSLARAWSQFMAQYPLVLSPVWTQLPFEVGFDVAAPENVVATGQMSRPVLPSNLFGLPSACVPAGRDAATGLPIGVLLTGRPHARRRVPRRRGGDREPARVEDADRSGVMGAGEATAICASCSSSAPTPSCTTARAMRTPCGLGRPSGIVTFAKNGRFWVRHGRAGFALSH